MALSNREKQYLQALLTDRRWPVVQKFVEQYINENLYQSSIKRESDFDTIWYAAENEGARRHIRDMMNQMEQEAGSLE